jgi:putative transposase
VDSYWINDYWIRFYHEESYTFKCSFLDKEPIKHHDIYAGKRIKRGLFQSATSILMISDINGASNILRKVVGDAVYSSRSIGGFDVKPY